MAKKLLKKTMVSVELWEDEDGKCSIVTQCVGDEDGVAKLRSVMVANREDAEVLYEMKRNHDCPQCGDDRWARRAIAIQNNPEVKKMSARDHFSSMVRKVWRGRFVPASSFRKSDPKMICLPIAFEVQAKSAIAIPDSNGKF